MVQEIIARSFKNLINGGRKTIDDVPEDVLPYLKEIAPELFKKSTKKSSSDSE